MLVDCRANLIGPTLQGAPLLAMVNNVLRVDRGRDNARGFHGGARVKW